MHAARGVRLTFPSVKPTLDVLLLSRYASRGASSRVRMYQYFPDLAAAGIRVTAAPLLAGEDLGRRQTSGGYPVRRLWAAILGRIRAAATRHRYDVLWIEYELMPFLPARLEHLLLRGGPPRVVEYDDAVFHRYDRHRSALVRRFLGAKIDRVMAGAAVVVAGNAYLAARARAAGARDVAIIPSVVDLERYPVVPPPAGGPPVIGWIGSPSTAAALDVVAPALARVCAGGRARVVLVGVTPGLRSWPFPCEERPWIENGEAADIAGFDIGIMPLADDAWSRGKCGFKLVQYLACGRPAVASPVGVNPAIVLDGQTGLLASSEAEWVTALDRLIDDPALRARLGAAGRAHVDAHYAMHRTAPLVADVLRRAAGGAASCAA
ncbi:MAG: glycosyltransferase family 4 protein [Vicinamibacteraceae bacterium]